MSYRVIVTGDRHWACHEIAQRVVDGLIAKHGKSERVVIVEGGADGVDMAFHAAAVDRGLEVESHPVSREDWRRLGKKAGPLRNAHMIARRADLCIAVHKNILDSRGTKDCVIQASGAGIPVWLIQGDGKPKRLTEEHLAAIRGDWEPPSADEPIGSSPPGDESESEGEAMARLVDASEPRVARGFICSRGKGCQPIAFTIGEAPAGSPGNVAGVVQRAMREAPDDRDDRGRSALIDGPPQFGQPAVSFHSHMLGAVAQANGKWRGDHPTEPEPIHWEEVLLHLAFVSMNAKLHGRDIGDETITHREWVDTLANVHRHARGGEDFLMNQLAHYIERALLRAEERLAAGPAEPPAPEPAPERHANRRGKRAPAPSKATAEAKLDKAAQSRPKRKGKK